VVAARPVWTTGITDATDFVLAIFLLADAGLPRALSSEVDAGSREENTTKQQDRASVLIPSKLKRLQSSFCALAGVLMPQFMS
jgi:hypothetical protein